ncbi:MULTISPECIES: AI-2E family transporter [Calditerrivibrio]|uniref:AI-2E family transporter n=1 Tax=Calditerrivibrio TaxID=545865 RepID=UPI003C71BF58
MEVRIDFNLKTIVTLSLLFLLVIFYIKLQSVINMFAIAFLISYLLIPLVHFVEDKLKIGRVFSVILIFSVFSGIVVLFLIIVIPLLYAEIFNLFKNLPSYAAISIEKINNIFEKYNYQVDLTALKQSMLSKLNEHGSELFKGSLNIITSIITSISTLLGFFVIPILVFYFLKDFEFIFKKGVSFIKTRLRIDIDYYNYQFNSILKGYFRGQLMVCFILGILYGVVDLLVGIKGGFAIGFISGLLSFIPYLGFITGFVSSIIMSYLQFGDILHPLLVVVGFMLVQSFESYFLTPKLVGEHLGLHPIAVIFALFAGGYLMGIGGMILSIPLAAFIKIVINKFLDDGTIFIDKTVDKFQ